MKLKKTLKDTFFTEKVFSCYSTDCDGIMIPMLKEKDYKR